MQVRVRGIYATAIAKILMDAGVELSDVSKKLSERLGGYSGVERPPHVTVKTSEDPSEVVIIGFPDEAKRVWEILNERLPYALIYKARPNIHSAFKAKIIRDGGCYADLGCCKARLRECPDQEEAVVEVVKSKVKPLEEVIAEPGLRVIGFYAEVMIGKRPGVTFSKHITNPERKLELTNLASDLVSSGLRIHWRSAARDASLVELREELEELSRLAWKLWQEAREMPAPSEVYRGEGLYVLRLGGEDKLTMDRIRDQVLPTAPLHHIFKSFSEPWTTLAEYNDALKANGVEEGRIVNCSLNFILERFGDCKRFVIKHYKIEGKTVEIGGYVQGVVEGHLVMKRVAREYGIYDGLNVMKEPGDLMITMLRPLDWKVIHAYFSKDGALKGIYVNVNTPVEVAGCEARYIDLEIDVILGNENKIIEEDELKKWVKEGIVKEELYEKARGIAEEALNKGDDIRRLVFRVSDEEASPSER